MKSVRVEVRLLSGEAAVLAGHSKCRLGSLGGPKERSGRQQAWNTVRGRGAGSAVGRITTASNP